MDLEEQSQIDVDSDPINLIKQNKEEILKTLEFYENLANTQNTITFPSNPRNPKTKMVNLMRDAANLAIDSSLDSFEQLKAMRKAVDDVFLTE